MTVPSPFRGVCGDQSVSDSYQLGTYGCRPEHLHALTDDWGDVGDPRRGLPMIWFQTTNGTLRVRLGRDWVEHRKGRCDAAPVSGLPIPTEPEDEQLVRRINASAGTDLRRVGRSATG